ncbi:PTS glucose transporter subunit IIA [Fusobacterium sp.]|uniref:PTS sugar transporter subunit IIA n=1 Tax=Fusobacterium sp. TaxID=68766 RepID=UPI00262DD507|nr:PTS glucose transporter subunit IIA [Fusobacterium sp.]
MGFFDFLKGKKDKKVVEIYSPLAGRVIPLEEVPDDAFSQKMIGDGCAIDPAPGAIYAPIDGEIDIFETNHAISVETPSGLELIIHFGVDTVKLNKEGLVRIAENGGVKRGAELVKYDLDLIKSKNYSTKTPIIVTNMDVVESIEVVANGDVNVGDLLMKVTLK